MMSYDHLMERGRSDASRPPSPARLAAEAFFSVPPTAASEKPETTVVVRRRQPVAGDSEMPPQTPSESETRDEPETRAPRVFRLESVPPTAEAPPASEYPKVEQSVALDEATPPVSPPGRRLPRKKARQLHSEVTLIRPAQDATPQGSVPEMFVHAEPPLVAQSEVEIVPASPQAQRRRPGRTLERLDDAWPHYPKLLARIRALEAEAKVLKELEAAEAVQWIRQAIATYGLTPRELEFGDQRHGQASAPGQPGIVGTTPAGRRRSR